MRWRNSEKKENEVRKYTDGTGNLYRKKVWDE